MVLRTLSALHRKQASATHLRHLLFRRRRRCSSSVCDGKIKPSEPWVQADFSAGLQYEHEDNSPQKRGGIQRKQYNGEGASAVFLQEDEGYDGFRCRKQKRGGLIQIFSRVHAHLYPVIYVRQRHDQCENSISVCDDENYGDNPDPQHEQHDQFVAFYEDQSCENRPALELRPSYEHNAFGQPSLESSNGGTAVGLLQQGGQDCSPARRLWQEKEQVLFLFSSKYSDCLAKNQVYTHSFEDPKFGLILGLCREGLSDRALDVLFCMDSAPPTSMYLFLLNECSINKTHIQARKIYAHFDHYHTSFADLIADFLVLSIRNSFTTQTSSLSLPCLSVFAWSAMISALVEDGHIKVALKTFQRMFEDGAEPSSYIFVSLVKACSIIKDLWHGMTLHAAAVMKGCATHLIVGSTLVSMYGKCGAILEAENLFNALCAPDVVSCNAMLAAFVEVGQGDRALLLYRQMHVEGMHPNHGTFVIALQACRCLAEAEEAQLAEERWLKLRSLEIGQALHSAIRREGFVLDAFINNTLVNMYGKIGAIVEAELVFDTVSSRDIISWNALLSTYIESNQAMKALWLYRMMLEEDVSMVPLTCVFALQACDMIAEDEQAVIIEAQTIKLKSLRLGQALHLDACTMGFTSDAFLGTALISMYGRCGAMIEAEDVFLSLIERDIISWNALLSAYIEQDGGEKALQLFRQMQEDNVGVNSQTIVFGLQACANLAEVEEAYVSEGRSVKVMALEIGQALHGLAIRECFSNSFVCNTLVNMYGNCGAILEAEHVFAAVSQHDVISWNVMLSAYVRQRQGVLTLQLYRQMLEKGTAPNHLTFLFALQACGILAEKERSVCLEGMLKKVVSLEIGSALHKDAVAKGVASDAYVGNALLSMYGKCGDVLEGESLFKSLLHCDIVSWNAMLSMYVEQGKAQQVLLLYEQLKEEQITCDGATLISILQACSMMGSLSVCEQVYFSIVCACHDQSPSVAATLLYAYSSCARVLDVKVFFDGLIKGDVVSWNAFIAGHLGEEDIASTVHLYEEMKQSGVHPDEVTFTSVLSACSHFGFVIDGFEYFQYMSRQYGILPNLRHYGAMIDLFGRAGDFKGVQILLKGMPQEPDLPIALCLLGVSRTHGNLQLAEWAFDYAVRLQPKQPTAYILMSNVYADANNLTISNYT